MKFEAIDNEIELEIVAPRVGAWIEMSYPITCSASSIVAPRVGAWIEINLFTNCRLLFFVAPRVGAWIEIGSLLILQLET